MFGTDKFQIRHGEPEHIGEFEPQLPGAKTKLIKGTPMMISDYVANESVVTTPTKYADGILLKEVTEAGPTFEQLELSNVYKDLPAKEGHKVTLGRLPDGAIIEVEGPDSNAVGAGDELLVTSGTGSLSGASGGEKLSLEDGRWREAQTGDLINGEVVDALTPNTAGNVRLAIRVVRGDTAA